MHPTGRHRAATARRLGTLLAGALLCGGCAASAEPGAGVGSPAVSGAPTLAAPTLAAPTLAAPTLAAPPPPLPRPPSRIIGLTAQGRPLLAHLLGRPDAARRVLVVGCIHGDEAAGIPIAEALLRLPPVAGTELVVVPDANPDGRLRGTRQNAHGVDLNRNFPYRWTPLGRAGDQQYAGPAPLSEPESRALAALIRQVRPTATVWFHQPLGLVDLSGGSMAVESRFAAVAGLPVRQLVRYPGSAAGWENHLWPAATAFVVELPRPVGAGLAARVLRAVRDLER